MNETETITGTIEKFIFQSQDNGFSVFVLSMRHNQKITAKGHIPHVQLGQEVCLKGSFIVHSKFGKQFNVESCVSKIPQTITGLKKYLGSGLIKGIGPLYAQKLINYFGEDILNIIDKQPERLKEVSGIGAKRIETISQAWREQKDIADVMVFLQDHGISTAFALKIYKKYKQESVAILQENPYRLTDDIWGIGFKSADSIAQKMGFSQDDPRRIRAGILYVISCASQSGHLYVELDSLRSGTIAALDLYPDQIGLIKHALHALYEQEKIKLITYEDKHYITLSSFYYSEKNIDKHIKTLLQTPSTLSFNFDHIYHNLRADNGPVSLNEDQQEGILRALQNKVSIITGGPGTGKTTLITQLLEVLESNRVSYKLTAPTGRAAKRMMESTRRHATTIHRLLEFDVSSMTFTHNEKNALKLSFLIVDEASMIDVFLAQSLIKAIPHHAHIVFIGDIDQLPSVGPGNVLQDFIQSGVITCTKLTHIFRQAQNSLITINAHKINKGEYPTSYEPDCKKDFSFIKEENPETIEAHLKEILHIKLMKKGITPDKAMVLTPMNKGPVGAHTLNHILQNLLNAYQGPDKVTIAGSTFKYNDRVMQIRNNYDKKVFNGDIGTIDSIDASLKKVIVTFDNQQVEYEFDELNELVLAYAISIHKSQGSEFPAVIMPLFMQHFMLLQRNLIYTGLTRAKKQCIFIGQPKALICAIKNTKGTHRITFLDAFLSNKLS
jgi:exodeoxyribonuclease V alpha subunit